MSKVEQTLSIIKPDAVERNLTENIKNPSLTIKLHPEDELDRGKATQIMYSIENTKLIGSNS